MWTAVAGSHERGSRALRRERPASLSFGAILVPEPMHSYLRASVKKAHPDYSDERVEREVHATLNKMQSSGTWAQKEVASES